MPVRMSEARFKALLTRAIEVATGVGRRNVQYVAGWLAGEDDYFRDPMARVQMEQVLRTVYGLADEQPAAVVTPPPADQPPAAVAAPPSRRVARRFQLDDDAAAAPEPCEFTLHLCVICGAFWRQFSDSWSLHPATKKAGACCDNRAMREQIVRIYFEPRPWKEPDEDDPDDYVAVEATPNEQVFPGLSRSGGGANIRQLDSAMKDVYADLVEGYLNRPNPFLVPPPPSTYAGIERTTEPQFAPKIYGSTTINRNTIQVTNDPSGSTWIRALQEERAAVLENTRYEPAEMAPVTARIYGVPATTTKPPADVLVLEPAELDQLRRGGWTPELRSKVRERLSVLPGTLVVGVANSAIERVARLAQGESPDEELTAFLKSDPSAMR